MLVRPNLRFLIVAAAAMLAVVCAPRALAQDATDRPLMDVCAGLEKPMTADDVVWLSFIVRGAFPAVETLVLKRVAFHESERDDLFGPEFNGDDARPELVLPKQFFATQCRLILMQFYLDGDTKFQSAPFAAGVKRCVHAGEGASTCVNRAIDAYIRSRPALDMTKIPVDQMRDLLGIMAFSAVKFALAHEAAHVVLRAHHPGRSLWAINVEFEADLLAGFALIEDHVTSMGALASLSTMSLIDDGTGDGAHEPWICRLGDAKILMSRVIPLTIAIKAEANDLAKVKRPEMLVWARDQFQSGMQSAGDASRCDPPSVGRIAAIERDLQLIYDAQLATIDAPGPTSAAREAFRGRIALDKLKTAEGRRVGAQQSITLLQDDSDALIARAQQNPASPDVRSDYITLTQRALAAVGPTPETYLKPIDAADFIRIQALLALMSHPAGTDIYTADKAFTDDMDRAEKFATIDDALRLFIWTSQRFPAAMKAIGEKKKDELVLQDFMLSSLSLIPRAVIGDCAKVEEIKRSMLEFSNGLGKSLDINAPEMSCSSLKVMSIAEQQRTVGWVWHEPAQH